MKKLILFMLALMTVSFTAQAQKKSKAEREADQARQELVTKALMDRIVPAKNFQFIPTSYMQTNTGTTNINDYKFTKIRPTSLEVDMPKCPGVNTNRYEWSCEEKVGKKGSVWVVEIKAIGNNGNNLEFNFAIDAGKGTAVLKLRSNKSLDGQAAGANSATYRGDIREY